MIVLTLPLLVFRQHVDQFTFWMLYIIPLTATSDHQQNYLANKQRMYFFISYAKKLSTSTSATQIAAPPVAISHVFCKTRHAHIHFHNVFLNVQYCLQERIIPCYCAYLIAQESGETFCLHIDANRSFADRFHSHRIDKIE